MKKLLAWLNDRTGYNTLMDDALYERIPGGSRWRYVWGSSLVFAFTVQVITGLFLWTAYSPSAQTAWESVYYIQHEMLLGNVVRGIHHFAAQAMIVLLALHLIQIVIDGAYRAPREVNFWLGLILMQIVLAMSLTGYLLPWDQKGYYATQVATKILGATPLVGTQLQNLVQGGPEYGHHTLTRFFALHAGILPALLIGFLMLHLHAFRRHGVTARRPLRNPDTFFWPEQVLKDGIVCLTILAVVVSLAWFNGAPLSAPANPAESYSAARPEWYFLFLFQFLRFEAIEHYGLAFGAIYVPGAIMLMFVLMPLIGRWEIGHKFNVAFLWMMVLGVVGLTGYAMWFDNQDESFQVAVAEADRDAERIVELAQRPSKIPVQGAITLLREDPFTQGPRLFAKHCSICHRYDGHDGTGRMVYDVVRGENGESQQYIAHPTAADLGNLGEREWYRSLLLNYSDHFAAFKQSQWHQLPSIAEQQLDDLKQKFEALKAEDAENKEQQLRQISESLIALGSRVRNGPPNRRLQRMRDDRQVYAARAKRLESLIQDVRTTVGADDDSPSIEELNEKLKEVNEGVEGLDGEIEEQQQTIADVPEELQQAVSDPQQIAAQIEKVAEIVEESKEDDTRLNLDASDMAGWSNDHREALSDEAHKEQLDSLIEFLVSLSGREGLDAKLVEQGEKIATEGLEEPFALSACIDCHALTKGSFKPKPMNDNYAPELTGLYSKAWLKDFLSHPARSQHYAAKNQMPGFADRLSDEELDLLVRWMLKDYHETQIEPHRSRIEELQQGLTERPDQ